MNYRLGQGGTAEVWAATNGILGIQVALKVLFGGHPILQRRLLREGRAQAALDHPHILPVRDIIVVGDSVGLILPLIQGSSLDKLLSNYQPTVDEAVALFRSIVEGVGHAHEHGLIHRDLKPGNVLLEERRGRIVPRVADFGLVKSIKEPSYTKADVVMGTLNYAAPEQLRDAASVDRRADLFSLGIVFVELLTGELPFQGASLREQLLAYRAGPDVSGVPKVFQRLCRQLLSDEPDQRFSDCAALLAALKEVHPSSTRRALGPGSGVAKAIRGELVEGNIPDASRTGWFSDFFTNKDLDSGLPTRNNLPAELDRFIGREAVLQTLNESLQESRLVSILGTGGTGKTRLALQYARRHLSDYPGGVFFCDLSEAKTFEEILFSVSQALDAPLGQGDPLKQLGHAIVGHGRCLLIFDNFEQIVAHASETVGAWLTWAEAARFIVTSRVLLELDGEYPLRLSPLDEDEAVALFVERVAKKKRGFILHEGNRDAIHQLVRLLDGLPLAIELASARVKMMMPKKMLKRMHQRFQLLSAGKRNAAQRQSTLRAAIDWSWELLEPWEQSAFAQCAVFEDGFTLEAAEAVIDLADVEGAPWAMDAVQSLVDKSLLRLTGENHVGEMRFGMLMSIHEYARDMLDAMGAEAVASVRWRHATFYAQFGEGGALEALSEFDGVSQWWALWQEVDNLRVAHRFALYEGEVETAISLVLAFYAIAERQQPSIAIAPLNDTLNLDGIETAPRRVTVRRRLGQVLLQQGQTAAAQAHFTQALDIARAVGERRFEGQVLRHLGIVHQNQGRVASAQAHFTQTLDIARAVGDRRFEGITLNSLGCLYADQGQVALAQAHLTQALSIHREVGDRRFEGITLSSLGRLYANQGQVEAAQAHFTHALDITREVGDRRFEGRVLGHLGVLHWFQGQLEQAQAHFIQALDITHEIGNRHFEGVTLTNLGNLYYSQGQMGQAQAYYTQALSIHREIGNRYSEGMGMTNLGNILYSQGQLEQAKAHFIQALSIHREVGNRRSEGKVVANLGLVYQSQGRTAEAQAHYNSALSIAREIRARDVEGYLLGGLGLLAVLSGETEAGLRQLKQGEAILRELNVPQPLARLLCDAAYAQHIANNPDAAGAALNEARKIADDFQVNADSELARRIAEIQAIIDKDHASSNA
ncbi:MAG: tetratricopeptide repeat protein [Myxococcota bacterium]